MKVFKILVINPGSTSTKVAYFNNLECISRTSIQHDIKELSEFSNVIAQYPFRMGKILDYLLHQNIKVANIDAVVGRGGLLRPLIGGTYLINEHILGDLKNQKYGEHASNLGALLANEFASMADKPSYIVNPIVVDELCPLARYSGSNFIERKCTFHALNHKAMAKKAADILHKKYKDVNLVVAHIGGGISVAAHMHGNVVDVNNALEEGPFSPERTGGLPVLQLVDFCFNGKYSRDEIKKLLIGKGGLVSYLGTSDCIEIEKRVKRGDKNAENTFSAMAYQIAKEIGAQSAVLCGHVDGIILTGGLAHNKIFIEQIKKRIKFIASVMIFPGEDEMFAMAEGAYSVLTGDSDPLEYGLEK